MAARKEAKATAAGEHEEEPAPSSDPDDVHDVLMATVALRARSLHEQARDHADGVIGWTEGDDPKPIMFNGWELQALLRAVNEVREGELSQLRALAKITPAELAAAVAAREQIRGNASDAGAQEPRARTRASGEAE